ncbi:MAG: hypothetical protein PHX83_14595 [Acidobacteriia bacterium]|nr:hypothetical protein [Terriglobia bacterium]
MAKHGLGLGTMLGAAGAAGSLVAGLWWAAKAKGGKIVNATNLSVKGKSGGNWWVEYLGLQGPSTLSRAFRVYLVPPAEKGKAASAMIPVLEYLQLATDQTTPAADMLKDATAVRTATKFFDSTATAMNSAAMQDLNVKAQTV